MFEVYTREHPDDVQECCSIYDAYEAMSELVELGFSPVCERHGFSGHVRMLSWAEVVREVEGG